MGISDYNAVDALNKIVPGSPPIEIGKGIHSPQGHDIQRQAIQRIMADLKNSFLGGLPDFTAASLRDFLDVAPYVPTRTVLKALDTDKDTVVRLTESGREGVFKWTTGNFSSHIAADTQEGIYVKADDVSASTGAWVRDTQGGIWMWRWFGVTSVSVGGADQAPAINACMAIANIVEPWWILTGPGFFPMHSRMTTATFQLKLHGTISGEQQTMLYKVDYAEGTTGRGLISAVTHGIHLRDIVISGASGSGGSLVSIITNGTAMVGDTILEGLNLTAGNAVDYSLYIDGTLNTGSIVGIRDMRITNCEIFGAAVMSTYCATVRNLLVSQSKSITSGGSGSIALGITGVTGFFTEILNWSGGLISGAITLDKCKQVMIDSPEITSNVSNTADVTTSTIRAATHTSGTLQHNWTGGSRYDIGVSYQDRAAGYLASTVSNVTGAGGTPYTLILDTLSASFKGWASSLNYNTSNGRYTALYDGDHHFELEVCLAGITSVHTSFILKAEQYTSAGVAINSGTRQKVGNAFAQADGNGRLSIPMSCDILMTAGDYVIFTIFVEEVGGAGSAVVDIRGSSSSERWTHLEARLA